MKVKSAIRCSIPEITLSWPRLKNVPELVRTLHSNKTTIHQPTAHSMNDVKKLLTPEEIRILRSHNTKTLQISTIDANSSDAVQHIRNQHLYF
jgi:hypothetical protein